MAKNEEILQNYTNTTLFYNLYLWQGRRKYWKR